MIINHLANRIQKILKAFELIGDFNNKFENNYTFESLT
jgi:hypothetical protein